MSAAGPARGGQQAAPHQRPGRGSSTRSHKRHRAKGHTQKTMQTTSRYAKGMDISARDIEEVGSDGGAFRSGDLGPEGWRKRGQRDVAGKEGAKPDVWGDRRVEGGTWRGRVVRTPGNGDAGTESQRGWEAEGRENRHGDAGSQATRERNAGKQRQQQRSPGQKEISEIRKERQSGGSLGLRRGRRTTSKNKAVRRNRTEGRRAVTARRGGRCVCGSVFPRPCAPMSVPE